MIIIGSDHTGVELKKNVEKYLVSSNIKYMDVTDYDYQDGDDYPDVAYNICINVLKNSKNLGIAICGTGIGISIACNKMCDIRAAVCTDEYMSEMARKDNNANVLCLGARLDVTNDINKVEKIIKKFVFTNFAGGRHQKRLEKIKKLENINFNGEKL